ncbi:MAG: hypothetical protein ACO24P_00685 [Candidatus Nanopelagicaceae bacterium]
MSTSQGKTLLDLVNESAAANRINTVENALNGGALGQKNFIATWKGYELNGRPTVMHNGTLYNVSGDGFTGLPINSPVTLRAGKNTLSASWR